MAISFFQRISRAVIGRSRVDDDTLDAIEEALVESDMGVDTTLKVIDALEEKVAKDKKAELDTAFEACMMDGEVTVYALAEYMDLKPRTIKTRLKDDGRFWIDGEKVGRKEPGSAG